MLKNRDEMRFMDGEFWRAQVLEDLIPYWFGNAVDYLFEHGWDKKYGGWFSSITQTGESKDTFKGASAQLYSCVGLTQYYLAIADEQVLPYVLKSVY